MNDDFFSHQEQPSWWFPLTPAIQETPVKVYLVQKVWGELIIPNRRQQNFNNVVAVFFNESAAKAHVIELEAKRDLKQDNCGFYYEPMETSDAPT